MRTLDCTDLKCPLPLLRLKVAINEGDEDPFIRLITTDAISLRDIPAFLQPGRPPTGFSDRRPTSCIRH